MPKKNKNNTAAKKQTPKKSITLQNPQPNLQNPQPKPIKKPSLTRKQANDIQIRSTINHYKTILNTPYLLGSPQQIINTLCQLAQLHKSLHQYKQALTYFIRNFLFHKKLFGENQNINIASCHNNIGTTYKLMRQYPQALQHLNICYSIQRNTIGLMHQLTADTFKHVSECLCSMGQFDSSIKFIQVAYLILMNCYKTHNHQTISALHQIATVRKLKGDLKQSLQEMLTCLSLREKYMNTMPDDSQLSKILNNIGQTHDQLLNFKQAILYYNKSLKIALRILTQNSPQVANTYSNLGSAYMNIGDFQKAKQFASKSYKLKIQFLGPKHIDLAVYYNNTGFISMLQCDYPKAIELYNEGLSIQQLHYGDQVHPMMAISYTNLGNCYMQANDLTKSLQNFNKSIDIQQRCLRTQNSYYGQSLLGRASVYQKLSQPNKGLQDLQKAISIFEAIYGTQHRLTLISLQKYNKITKQMNEKENLDRVNSYIMKVLV